MQLGISEGTRQAIRAWAEGYPEIQSVYLYGSRARSDNEATSDIDLAVRVFADPAEGNFQLGFMDWYAKYEERQDLNLCVPVHIEWFEPAVILERVGLGVERDGVLLFERASPD